MKTSTTLALAALAAPLLALVGGPPAAAAAPTCQGKQATIVGTPRADRLVGTDGRDVIVARAGDDKVIGLRGDDLVCGGPGADELMGGSGDDRLFGQGDKRWVNSLGDTIITGDFLHGDRGDDLLHPGPQAHGGDFYQPDLVVFARSDRAVTVDLSAGPATGRATARGEGQDRIYWRPRLGVVGSRWDDHLVGTQQGDYLVGLDGDDTLEGASGRDLLYPDRAASAPGNAFPSSGGNDVVLGGEGEDDLRSYEGRDEIHGGAGDDLISVTGGVGDIVSGDEGGDLLYAYFNGSARGLDRVAFAGGADAGVKRDTVFLIGRDPARGAVVTLDASAGTLRSAAGGPEREGRVEGFEEFSLDAGLLWKFLGTDLQEEVWSDVAGRLHAAGRGGDDTFHAGPGRDRVSGGDGDDYLTGGDGDDVLSGNAGRDRLVGNAGKDTCRTGERVSGCEIR